MKRNMLILTVVFTGLLQACSEDESSMPAIADEEQAREAFLRIHTIWTATLQPIIEQGNDVTYTDEVMEGAGGGSVLVNGTFSQSRSSSASSTLNTSLTDVTLEFQQYTYEDLVLNGVLRFFDSYRYRYACSSSGCASSTHMFMSYASEGRDKIVNPPIAIEFEYNGRRYKDTILLDADKEYSTFTVKMTNSAGQEFWFNY